MNMFYSIDGRICKCISLASPKENLNIGMKEGAIARAESVMDPVVLKKFGAASPRVLV